MSNNDLLRLARCEAICENLRTQMEDVMQQLYAQACEEQDEEMAAKLVRALRNKLLDESDAHVCLDRCLPDAPSGQTFTAWLVWLKALANIAKNNWATYRQALRDVPQQEGFPFNVTFPDKPEENN